MNNLFAAKLLQNLRNKKGNKGFTLIELLVVVIIIGVLAAVALPNLLSQVGKARETELKNAVGTINRAQQAYHFEKQAFADTTARMGVGLNPEYIDNDPADATVLEGALTIAATAGGATVRPLNSNAVNDGTRAYSGGIFYNGGNYSQIVCQSETPATQIAAPGSAADTACDTFGSKVR